MNFYEWWVSQGSPVDTVDILWPQYEAYLASFEGCPLPADVESWIDHILTEVPLAPIPLIEQAIFNAVVDACKQSCIWQQEVAPIEVADKGDYMVTSSCGTVREIVCIDQTHIRWTVKKQGVLTILDKPKESITITPTVTLIPDRTLNTIPYFFYEQHFDLVTDGALAYLFDMRGVPWRDDTAAAQHWDDFRKELARYDQLEDRSFTHRELKVKPRKF